MADTATEAPGYARRWAAKRDELIERIEGAVELADLQEAQAELRELQRVAPSNLTQVPSGSARAEPAPSWGQLAGSNMGMTCVYCEKREGTGYDRDGRCVCGDRECRRKARA